MIYKKVHNRGTLLLFIDFQHFKNKQKQKGPKMPDGIGPSILGVYAPGRAKVQ
jgi:hypothetical protein